VSASVTETVANAFENTKGLREEAFQAANGVTVSDIAGPASSLVVTRRESVRPRRYVSEAVSGSERRSDAQPKVEGQRRF